jgi:hypothetical protein
MTSCLDLEIQTTASSGVLIPSIQSKTELIDMLIQVRSERSVNTIGGFVQQLRLMLDKLVKTQAKHKKIHAKMMKQCMGEGKFRKKEIRVAKTSLGKAKAHYGKCKLSLKHAVKELPHLLSTLNSYKKELARAQKQRNVEHAKYAKRRDAFRGALGFLKHFIKFVTQKLKSYHSESLVELSENLLKHANKLNVLAHAAPVLVEIAVQGAHSYKFTPNNELKAKLMKALHELFEKIKTDHESNEKVEKKAVALFSVYKMRLDKVIATVQKNVNRVRKQIRDMKMCIATEGGVIASSEKKIARNLKLLLSAAKMCKNFNKEFIEATYHRLDEIKTMSTIMKIVKHRFKKLPKDLVHYLEEIKNGFKKYVNSTEFSKFKEYERVKYRKNHRGALLAKLKASKDHNPLAANVKGKHGIY